VGEYMNVLEMLLQPQKGGPLDSLTSMSGLESNQMQQLLGQVLPVLAGGIKNGTTKQGGLEGLM